MTQRSNRQNRSLNFGFQRSDKYFISQNESTPSEGEFSIETTNEITSDTDGEFDSTLMSKLDIHVIKDLFEICKENVVLENDLL